MPQKIAILGLGWLGLPLAKALYEKGYEITGSTTSSEKLMQLLQSRLSVRIIKISKKTIEGNWKNFLKDADTLIINIPPGKKQNNVLNYPDQIEQITQRCEKDLNVIFVSSTSVYGDHKDPVNENSSTHPSTDSGKSLLAAENIIRNYFGENATIIRFAGLFGENRHPGRFLKPGKRISNPNGRINLIHLEDCIQLVTAVLEKQCFGETINGCSDEHPLRSDFYKKAAFALSLDTPEFDPNAPITGKIVDNKKSKDLLDIQYQYANPEDYL